MASKTKLSAHPLFVGVVVAIVGIGGTWWVTRGAAIAQIKIAEDAEAAARISAKSAVETVRLAGEALNLTKARDERIQWLAFRVSALEIGSKVRRAIRWKEAGHGGDWKNIGNVDALLAGPVSKLAARYLMMDPSSPRYATATEILEHIGMIETDPKTGEEKVTIDWVPIRGAIGHVPGEEISAALRKAYLSKLLTLLQLDE